MEGTITSTVSRNSIPTPWPASLAGAALFLLWGLELIGGEIPHEWAVPTWVHTLVGILFVSGLLLPPIALCVGWIQSFPRWSYPYVGHMVVYSLYVTSVATPGLRVFGVPVFGGELWGWRSWVPLLAVALIALLVTRSVRPLFRLFTQVWQDWTLLTFSLFGILPLWVAISFDEMDRLYSLVFMVILAVLMTGAALLYLRSRRSGARIAALAIGIVPTIAVTVVAPTLYWQRHGWVSPWGAALLGGAVLLVMALPAAIGLLRRALPLRPAG
jgi:hypothetical protein